MTTIVTRAGKGSSLSWSEGDANFTNLNNDKLETSTAAATYTTKVDPATSGTLTHSGDIVLTGTGKRITGDFSNATVANRVIFQTSTLNAVTSLRAIPNGTATGSNIAVTNSSDTLNCAVLSLAITSTVTTINSAINGTGTYLPLTFQAGGAEWLRIGTAGQIGFSGANYGTAGQVMISGGPSAAPSWGPVVVPDNSVTPAKLTQPFTAGTSVAVSGTSIDFTGIPNWAKRVTVICSGVSTNGTSGKTFRLGSGSVQASGYVCSFGYATTAASASTSTTGFDTMVPTVAEIFSGHLVLSKISGNTWVCSGDFTIQLGNQPGKSYTGGYVTLSGAMDRIRVTTNNGTDTFDAGSINIMWE